jgi:4-amino-4-deoxy-L-arabinose transferase and related glycosyltransferases of PMT family
MNKEKKVVALITFFSSLAVILVLLLFFSDTDRVLWGWNNKRNILILCVPVFILLISLFTILPIQESSKFKTFSIGLFKWVHDQLNLLALLSCLFIDGLIFFDFIGKPIANGLLEKCAPDFSLILILLFATAIAKTPANHKTGFTKSALFPLLFLGGSFLLLFINYSLTGLTFVITAQKYFGAGAPLLVIQALFAINSGFLCFFLLKRVGPKKSFIIFLDIFLFAVLFVSAYVYWNQVKIPLNFFMRALDSKTIAPYSDSRVYDLNGLGFAFGHGIGYGYPTQKPFYSFFLGILHLLFGQNYPQIISAQVLVLSLMPSLYYLASKQFLNRGVGLSGALLIIFREYNLVVLSNETTQSSVKMLTTDCFMTLFVLLLVLVTLLWINKPNSRKLAILTGVCLSVTILIRLQMAAFVPIYLIAYLIARKPTSFNIKGPLTLFLAGLILGLLPWMSRNLIRSGQFVIEQPEYVGFALIPNTAFDQAQNTPGGQSSESLVQLITSNSSIYLQHASSYLNNSLMSSLYQLPTDFVHLQNLDDVIHSGKFSYPFPYQELSNGQKLIWGLNILILFWGILSCWYRFKWKSLFPLAFYFAYALVISFAGYSGWRFIQPVDWIVFLYWCAGLFGLVELMQGNFVVIQNEEQMVQKQELSSEKGLVFVLFMALLIGSILPISEILIPSTSYSQTKQEVFTQTIPVISPTTDNISKFAKDPLSIALRGQALYPIYIFPGDYVFAKLRLGFDPYPAYYTKHIDYVDLNLTEYNLPGNTILFFTLANSSVQEVYLFDPKIISPAKSGEVTTLLGCDRGNYIQAYWVKIGNSIIESAAGIPQKCPSN